MLSFLASRGAKENLPPPKKKEMMMKGTTWHPTKAKRLLWPLSCLER